MIAPRMEIIVLASGSSGNAVLIRSGLTSILFDAGISALQVRRRLAAFGICAGELSAVLLSHEHSDHVRGLEVLLKRVPVPVWATAGTWSRLPVRAAAGGELCSGRELVVAGLRILPVATSHDAAEPVALVLDDGNRRVALCTDTGVVTPLLEQRLAGCDLVLPEANHDPDMLRHGSYPWPLKQRIASRLGHLANHQAAEALARIASPRLAAVIGLHLSQENNSPELAREVLREAVPETVRVTAVPRGEMLRIGLNGAAPVLDQRPAPPARGPLE